MKKQHNFSLIILLFSSLIFTGCQDDDDENRTPPTPPTKTDLITERNFGITDVLVTLNGDTLATLADIEECQLDDFMRFEKNGTGEDNAGTTKCYPEQNQSNPFSWQFTDSEGKLQIDYGMDDLNIYDIVTNDGTTLKLEQIEIFDLDGDGINDTYFYSLTMQKM